MAQHRILRQVIELEGCPPGTDAALRARLGDIVQRHLMPVLERAFDAVDAAGRLLRAERLELALAPVPITRQQPDRPIDEAWAGALARQLELHLAPALAEALQATDPRQADLELLAQFIDSGTVPWWAALQQPDLVPAALLRLLADARAPQALRALGLRDVDSGAAWQRLLATAGERQRHAWLAALWPAAPAPIWGAWRAALVDACTGQGATAAEGAALWWRLALPLAARQRAAGAEAPDAAGLSALAAAAGAALALPLPPLLGAWRQAFDRRLGSAAEVVHGTSSATWWRALNAAASGSTDAPSQAAANPADERTTGARAWLRRQAAALPADALVQRLFVALDRHWLLWPGATREAAEAALRATPGQAPVDGADSLDALPEAGWRALARLADAALQAGRLPMLWCDALHAAALPATTLREHAAAAHAGIAPLHRALQAVQAEAAAARTPLADTDSDAVDRRFADTSQVAVADAGLVLLWPFLPAFFARLGWLLDDGPQAGRAFVQPGGAARAAQLLHALASGAGALAAEANGAGDDAADAMAMAMAMADGGPALAPPVPVPEHLLPLAKLLCGLAPEAVLPAVPPPDAAALAEGELLLQAVIAQAPILREMPVAAFRSSFLWRAGQLSVQDGHWLLRVERAAYDMVRDRFPWGVAIVRLPWMHAALQVVW